MESEVYERFFAKVDIPANDNQCWIWKAYTDTNGYGTFWHEKASRGAHRVSHMIFHGPIPDGCGVHHTCDNPPCCNPLHLWAGTPAENNEDKKRKGRSKTGDKRPEKQIVEMLIAYAEGSETIESIAKKFSMSITHTASILAGNSRAKIRTNKEYLKARDAAYTRKIKRNNLVY